MSRVTRLTLAPWLLAALVQSGAALAAGSSEDRLTAAARATPRPQGCSADGGFWQQYAYYRSSVCSALARGYTLLRLEPDRARTLAVGILGSHPEHADARLLLARALVATRDFVGAEKAFGAAKLAARDLADVGALQDFARMLTARGRTREAAEAYRLLMPRRTTLTPNGGRRSQVLLEGAFALMHEGPNGASEVVALLTPALEDPDYRGFEPVLRATLELALDRKGTPIARSSAEVEPDAEMTVAGWLSEADAWLLRGWMLRHSDPPAAREALAKALERTPATAPFRGHTESLLRTLGGAG